MALLTFSFFVSISKKRGTAKAQAELSLNFSIATYLLVGLGQVN